MNIINFAKKLASASIITAALTTHGTSFAQTVQQPIVIKFSHVTSPDTPKGKAADYFATKAAELTKGRVKVEVYPNSTLYKDKEEIEALQLGAVQMLAPSLSKFAPLGVKEFELFDLPFIFSNEEDLRKITAGPVGKSILNKLGQRGLIGLAYWDNGFKVMHANSPIRTPADMKGKKMRIQSSKVLEEQMRSVGALPQVMAFSEVYQALQTGVVDGSENVSSNVFTQKHYEVQSNLTVLDHGYIGYAVVSNKKFWDGLPADIRQQLEVAVDQSARYANQIAKLENENALAAIKKSGKTNVYVPTKEERLAFKKAMVSVHQKMEGRIGKEVIQATYKEIGFKPDSL